ncbi:MAG: PH domain-containing protein [Erysipelotrichaceae bacterium]|nr:PH domain-containing protein [Erysipelotrichaceae bacterium]
MATTLWQDSYRILGHENPLITYILSEERISKVSDILYAKSDEVLLYRVSDVKWRQSIWQRLFDVGTVLIYTSDPLKPRLKLCNVKDSNRVKDMIYDRVEEDKISRGMIFIDGDYMEEFK